MTGYGQGAADVAGLRVTVELRTVNNRFTDLRLRIPGELGAAEAEVRRKVRNRVRRGRVELSVGLERLDGADLRPVLNRPLLEEVLEASRLLREEFRLEGGLDHGAVLGVPGLFKADSGEVPWGEAELGALHRALDAGLQQLDEDRRREGKRDPTAAPCRHASPFREASDRRERVETRLLLRPPAWVVRPEAAQRSQPSDPTAGARPWQRPASTDDPALQSTSLAPRARETR